RAAEIGITPDGKAPSRRPRERAAPDPLSAPRAEALLLGPGRRRARRPRFGGSPGSRHASAGVRGPARRKLPGGSPPSLATPIQQRREAQTALQPRPASR